MMSLPQLLDGLGRGRMDIIQKAFTLHHAAFRAEFVRHLSNGNTPLAEEHIERMAILFETLMNHLKKSTTSTPFVVNLRMQTLDHIKALVQELGTIKLPANSPSSQQRKGVLELLNFYQNHLQNINNQLFVKSKSESVPMKAKAQVVTSAHSASNPTCDILMNTLSSKSDNEIVRYALLSSDAVACAQQILLSRKGGNVKEVNEFFQKVAHDYVVDLLEMKQIDVAKDVLRNADRDIWTALKSICLETCSSTLRDYLAFELNSVSVLDPSELDTWKFLILVEGITKNTGLEVHVIGEELRTNKHSEAHESKLSISSLMNLPASSEARSSLLMELYFETLNGTLEPMLNKDECWKYLLLNNRLDILIKWIKATYLKTCETAVPNRLVTFLSSWNVTQQMVDFIPTSGASGAIKECLLDFLSMFDVVSTDEHDDVQKLLLRAVHTGRILNGLDDRMKDLLVQFCAQCNMPDLLVSCDIRTNLETQPWIKLYSDFQMLSTYSDVKKCLCECVKLSADFLRVGVATSPQLSLTLFLLSDHPVHENVCEALLDVTSEAHDGEKLLLEAFSSYPELLALMSKKAMENTSEISLPSLLRKKFSSDSSSQVLKQQSLCSIFRDESVKNEVSFSHEPTILLYGHNEVLDFQYFLKQGRPCHATMLVLADMIKNYGKPSRKLLKRTILGAHETAYQNMRDQTVTASCIAFLEMLGEKSLSLRVNLAVLNQIMSLKTGEMTDCGQTTNFNESMMHLFLSETGTLNHQEVYMLLKGSVPYDIHKQGLAVQFASLYNLPLPTSFLVHCAQNDDWIILLLFCQIYNYPPEIVKKTVRQFQSSSIREHLELFLFRYPLASKASSRTFKAPPKPLESNAPSSEGLQSLPPPLTEEDLTVPLPTFHAKDSLLGVLLACHNSSNPAESLLEMCIELPCPVLAVLSEFYQAHSEAQLVAWFASWLPQDERVDFEGLQKNTPWSSKVVESLIMRIFQISRSNLLLGFSIFLPEHPLVAALKIAENFPSSDNPDRDELQTILQDICNFFDMCENLPGNEPWCLSSTKFVLQMGLQIWRSAMISMGLRMELEETFLTGKMPESNAERKPDALQHSSERNWQFTGSPLDPGNFINADSQIVGSSIIAEEKDKFQKWLESGIEDFKTICEECDSRFEQNMVDPCVASKYFYDCASRLSGNVDRWRALHHSLKWLQRSELDSSNTKEMEHKEKIESDMWHCCLREHSVNMFNVIIEELGHSPLSSLCCETLGIVNLPIVEEFHQREKTCAENPCLAKLLSCLLDVGDVVSASRVQNIFQSKNKDFEVLQVCLSLAEGKIKVHEIPNNLSAFIPQECNDSQSQDSSSSSSAKGQELKKLSETPGSEANPSAEKLEILHVIVQLCKQLEHGKEIGKQLIACYRLSLNLNLAYTDITSISDPLKLLRTAISQSYCGGLSVAADIMVALRLSAHERAQLLSREIIAAISKGPTQGNIRKYHMWGLDIEQHFQNLLELVPDPSLLGFELMNMIRKLSCLDKNTPKPVLETAVELLVRAHDCYSAACHMEGISNILRTVNNFASVLKTRSEWALMVRLLTGIQRYTEMNYIFKILKENDHFEFLLRKDSVKPLSFKLALLDWLRRECADDTALLKITAAHFQMHQQEAELWQREGNDRISDLVAYGLKNNQKSKAGLQMALQDFSHASECYRQADMLNHAMTCANQAELVALQIYLLSSNSDGSILQVIMLDSKSVSKIIISTLSFHQALIVARAYNHRADWAAALFYHCISPGLSTEEYFTAWSSRMELSPLIVQNLAYRLQRTPAITREMTSNMQWILRHVKDMDVRYKIASELGLKDMVESLLQAPEVAYLKDTVWLRGFKR